MIIIGCDHSAVSFKQEIMRMLSAKGIEFLDVGAYSTESCDYPDFAEKVCRAVSDGTAKAGILICGTGVGMSIAANKLRGIRCALCTDTFSARNARRHNDANVLALGCFVLGTGLAADIIETFLGTEFSGGERHVNRIGKITALERNRGEM